MTALLIALIAAVGSEDTSLYVSTPPDVVKEMLVIAEVTESDTVYDLGCGAGRIVITAAVRYGCQAVGIELDAELCRYARKNAITNNVEELVTIRQGDVLTEDLSGGDVVCLYLMPGLLSNLQPRLRALKVGTRIVAHDKAIPGWKPTRTQRVWSEVDQRDHMVYLYVVVAKCKGGT